MANSPNVESLAEAIAAYINQEGCIDLNIHDADEPLAGCGHLAKFLADRGVLVISDAVLTDEAIENMMTEVAGDHWAEMPKYENGRAALSRLAKGEAP